MTEADIQHNVERLISEGLIARPPGDRLFRPVFDDIAAHLIGNQPTNKGEFFVQNRLNESQPVTQLPVSVLDQYRARKQAQQDGVITRLAGRMSVQPSVLREALWAEGVDLEVIRDAMEGRR